jgi:GTP-binding protein HflX
MARKKIFETQKANETAVLVGVITQQQRLEQAEEYLDELEFLALTAGAVVKNRFLQRLPNRHPKTYIGEGKLEEIKEYCEMDVSSSIDAGLKLYK